MTSIWLPLEIGAGHITKTLQDTPKQEKTMIPKFEIVEAKGKKYAQFEDSEEIRKILKKMIICAGGIIYKNEGKLVYAVDGAYGNLEVFYTKVFRNVLE